MGVMKRLLDRVLVCIAYKVVHQPFFGLKISSQVLTAFAIRYHKRRNCLESSGWLFFEPFRLCIYYFVYMGPTPGKLIQVGVEQWFYKCFIFMLRLMKPSDLFAFEVILLMWVLKFILVDKSTQRYLAADTMSRVWLCIVYEIFMGALALVMGRTWHLPGLNDMSHFTSHRC